MPTLFAEMAEAAAGRRMGCLGNGVWLCIAGGATVGWRGIWNCISLVIRYTPVRKVHEQEKVSRQRLGGNKGTGTRGRHIAIEHTTL